MQRQAGGSSSKEGSIVTERLDMLESKVKEAREVLRSLEEQAADVKAKAQHEVVDELEQYLDDECLKRESLLELSEEAWLEVKGALERLIQRVRDIKK